MLSPTYLRATAGWKKQRRRDVRRGRGPVRAARPARGALDVAPGVVHGQRLAVLRREALHLSRGLIFLIVNES